MSSFSSSAWEDANPGPLSSRNIGFIVLAVGCLALLVFACWKKKGAVTGFFRRVFKRTAVQPTLPLPAAARGGVTHPTASPRKWKSVRKSSVDSEVYGGHHGMRECPSPIHWAPSLHSRSASSASGASSYKAPPAMPVAAIIPPAPVHLGDLPRVHEKPT